MAIEIASDAEFADELKKAGSAHVLVHFFSPASESMEAMITLLADLLNKQPGVIFLKVDVQKCYESAVSQSVLEKVDRAEAMTGHAVKLYAAGECVQTWRCVGAPSTVLCGAIERCLRDGVSKGSSTTLAGDTVHQAPVPVSPRSSSHKGSVKVAGVVSKRSARRSASSKAPASDKKPQVETKTDGPKSESVHVAQPPADRDLDDMAVHARMLQKAMDWWTERRPFSVVPAFFFLLGMTALFAVCLAAATLGAVHLFERHADAHTPPPDRQLCPAAPVWTNCSPHCAATDYTVVEYFLNSSRSSADGCVPNAKWLPCAGATGCRAVAKAAAHVTAPLPSSPPISCIVETDYLSFKVKACDDESTHCFAYTSRWHKLQLGCYSPSVTPEHHLKLVATFRGAGCGGAISDGHCELVLVNHTTILNRERDRNRLVYLCCCTGDVCNADLVPKVQLLAQRWESQRLNASACVTEFRVTKSSTFADLVDVAWNRPLSAKAHACHGVVDLCFDNLITDPWYSTDAVLNQTRGCAHNKDWADLCVHAIADSISGCYNLHGDMYFCCCRGPGCTPPDALAFAISSNTTTPTISCLPPRGVNGNETCASGLCYELLAGTPLDSPSDDDDDDEAVERGCVGATGNAMGLGHWDALTAACKHAACVVTHTAADAAVSLCCCGADDCNDGKRVREFRQPPSPAESATRWPWLVGAILCCVVGAVSLLCLTLFLHAVWQIEAAPPES